MYIHLALKNSMKDKNYTNAAALRHASTFFSMSQSVQSGFIPTTTVLLKISKVLDTYRKSSSY